MSQVITEIKNAKDLMILIDMPRVVYIGNSRSGEHRITPKEMASGFDYGVFRKGIPETVYNLTDLKFFAHEKRRKNFKIIIQRIPFPQYKYIELQNADQYYSKVINFCIAIGAEHVNPPEDLKELTEEERLSIAKAQADELARKKKENEVFKTPKRKFSDLKKIDLKIMAKTVTITGYSKMTKPELVKALTEYYNSEFIPTEEK